MRPRTVLAVVLLVTAALVGAFAVLVGYGLTAEYGDIAAGTWENFTFGMEIAALGLVPVLGLGLGAWLLDRRRGFALAAAALPVLLVLGVLATTPLAVQKKLAVQYDASPDCVAGLEGERGPGVTGARRAQATFDGIEHVGRFGGGGSSGVDGCDRTLTAVDGEDVLAHYRRTLPADGWRVTESGDGHLRAERDGAAFEVRGAGTDWVVWTGPREVHPRALGG